MNVESNHRRKRLALTIAAIAPYWIGLALAQEAHTGTHQYRMLPVPDHVSPELRKLLEQKPVAPLKLPTTADQWKALTAPDPDLSKKMADMSAQFGVTLALQVIGGVRCYVITPKVVPYRNRHRLLLGLHSGGFVFGAGEAAASEAIVMSSTSGAKAIAIDYRMLPQYPFPAALDDAMAVYKELIKSHKPVNVGLFGSSVGGSMVLSMVQRAKKEGLPVPGALMSGSPTDMSRTGDSSYANLGVDHWLTLDYDSGFWPSVVKLYAGGRELTDPQISPVYGDFSGFSPTILVSGTRDLYLSNAVRIYHQLERAGVPVRLEIEEAQPHMAYLYAALAGAPEGADLYLRVARFFDHHLGDQ